ncbi:uncharacterized protein LOC133892208 [Phragmites australis]|uniref:uncharacterized protein LOC133892208 n=1 Tax=Phragmites australis TaxID=29695 RepID=UPI002D7927D4|nr:uncharacterized protein LOC133892208 [Phragmites australis]
MPYSVFEKLGKGDNELIRTNLVLNVFTGDLTESKGVIAMELTIGRKMVPTAFFFADVQEIYIDDIVVKLDAMDSQFSDLHLALERMRQYGLQMNPLKCAFGVSQEPTPPGTSSLSTDSPKWRSPVQSARTSCSSTSIRTASTLQARLLPLGSRSASILAWSLNNYLVLYIEFLHGILGTSDNLSVAVSRMLRALMSVLDNFRHPVVKAFRGAAKDSNDEDDDLNDEKDHDKDDEDKADFDPEDEL